MAKGNIVWVSVAILFVFATGMFVIVSEKDVTVTTSTERISWGIIWKKESDTALGIKFEIPSNWEISVRRFISNVTQAEYYEVVACPPKAEQVAARGGYRDSCIVFYEKDRLLNPPSDLVEGLEEVFGDFQGYLRASPNTLRDLRIMNNQILLPNDDLTVGMEGLHIKASDMIGIRQLLCRKDMSVECILIFRHVLESLAFGKF